MKQGNEIDNVLREVAKLRDKQLRAVPSLSAKRRSVLTGFLTLKFPMESALREVAARRDQSLETDPPKMPGAVGSALYRQLLLAEAAQDGAREWRASDWGSNASIWRRIFRSPFGAGLTACAVITTAILCFAKWGNPPRRSAAQSLPQAIEVSLESAVTMDLLSSRAGLFSRRVTLGPFNLSTSEPASLETSFVSNRRIQFADGIETPLGLRLDLAMRATLMEDDFARTP